MIIAQLCRVCFVLMFLPVAFTWLFVFHYLPLLVYVSNIILSRYERIRFQAVASFHIDESAMRRVRFFHVIVGSTISKWSNFLIFSWLFRLLMADQLFHGYFRTCIVIAGNGWPFFLAFGHIFPSLNSRYYSHFQQELVFHRKMKGLHFLLYISMLNQGPDYKLKVLKCDRKSKLFSQIKPLYIE